MDAFPIGPRRARVGVVATLLALVFAGPALAVAGGQRGGPAGSNGDDVSTALRAELEARQAAWLRARPPAKGAASPAPYLLHPQGGNVNGDLWPNGFVDLDPTAGIGDFACSEITYDGHRGHDTDLRTFVEQEIGVPVFAALDGTVADLHDGEPDHNLGCVEPSNYVILDHGGTHFSWYLHLRSGSVAATGLGLGDPVVAGQQIGFTASSGCSFWPHLHFESRFGGSHVEPSSGPCRPGASGWVRQPPLRTDTFLTDFTITADDLTQWAGAPFDTSRTGHLLLHQTPHFWLLLKNLPAGATWRTRFRNPSGTIVLDESGDFDGNPYFRSSVWWQRWFLDLDQVGTWAVLYDVDGVNLVTAPFRVVASPAGIVEGPPHPIGVALDPPAPIADDVVFCRVATSLLLDDPDYDVVRYRYRWTLDGVLVRDVTHAGQADTLPRDLAAPDDLIECEVTPSDGTLAGSPVSAGARFGLPCTGAPGDGCLFADDFELGDTSRW